MDDINLNHFSPNSTVELKKLINKHSSLYLVPMRTYREEPFPNICNDYSYSWKDNPHLPSICLERYPGHNYGIHPKSGLLVINATQQGIDTLCRVLGSDEFEILNRTFKVITPYSKIHFYFKYDSERTKKLEKNPLLKSGVTFLTNGVITAPGSTLRLVDVSGHNNSTTTRIDGFRIINDVEIIDIDTYPELLSKIIRAPQQKLRGEDEEDIAFSLNKMAEDNLHKSKKAVGGEMLWKLHQYLSKLPTVAKSKADIARSDCKEKNDELRRYFHIYCGLFFKYCKEQDALPPYAVVQTTRFDTVSGDYIFNEDAKYHYYRFKEITSCVPFNVGIGLDLSEDTVLDIINRVQDVESDWTLDVRKFKQKLKNLSYFFEEHISEEGKIARYIFDKYPGMFLSADSILYIFNGKYWEKDDKAEKITRIVQKIGREIIAIKDEYKRYLPEDAAEDEAAYKGEGIKRKQKERTKIHYLITLSKKCGSSTSRKEVAFSIQNMIPSSLRMSTYQLKKKGLRYIGCKNGAFDTLERKFIAVKDGERFPKDWYLTELYDRNYLGEGVESSYFNDILDYQFRTGRFKPEFKDSEDELDDQIGRRSLAHICAYLITPVTKWRKFFIFLGDGSEGKSYLLSGILNDITKDDKGSPLAYGEIGVDLLQGGSGTKEHGRINKELEGRNIAHFEELKSDKSLKEDALKRISTYSSMTVRDHFRESRQTISSAKVVITTNNIPEIEDDSSGIESRMVIIPFTEKLQDAMEDSNHYMYRYKKYKFDNLEKDKLFTQLINFLPVILDDDFKLKLSKRSRDEVRKIKRPSTLLFLDFTEYCIVKSDQKEEDNCVISKKMLFEACNYHAVENGFSKIEEARFYKLADKKFTNRRAAQRRYKKRGVTGDIISYIGIKFSCDFEQNFFKNNVKKYYIDK